VSAVLTIDSHLLFDLGYFFEVLFSRVGLVQNVVLLVLEADTAKTVLTAEEELGVLTVARAPNVGAEVTVVAPQSQGEALVTELTAIRVHQIHRVFGLPAALKVHAVLTAMGVKAVVAVF